MGEIIDGPHHEDAPDPSEDGDRFRWRYKGAGGEHDVVVLISRTASSSDPSQLDIAVGAAVQTKGRTAVEEALQRERTPKMIRVETAGLWEDPPID